MTESIAATGFQPTPTTYSAEASGRIAATFIDIVDGFRSGQVWRAFAWEEIQRRYRRTVFGIAWIAISFAIFVAGISLFFSGFSDKSNEYFVAYVATGFAAFTFITSNVQDGATVFTGARSWIKSVSLPYSVYVYKSVSRTVLPFALQFLVFMIFAIAIGHEFKPVALISLLSIPILLINAVGIQLALGYVCACYRDLGHLVTAIVRISFFVTPILWMYDEMTGVRKTVADLNPATHFLEIFRAPILGYAPPALSWWAVAATTVIVWALAIIASLAYRRRIPFLV